MTLYFLDTNIVSHLLRYPTGPVNDRIREVGLDNIAVSIIVVAEMRFGAVKRKSIVLSQAIEDFVARTVVLPFEPPADEVYANIRVALENAGTPIGANDLLIAAHALALDATLVTDNVREFARIEGLKLENWRR